MGPNVYDLKDFYSSRAGRLVRRILRGHIRSLWPETAGLRIMGGGYALPFLRDLGDGSERTFAVLSSQAGVHHWPEEGKPGLVALGEEDSLPLETESVDRILLVHGFEHSKDPDALLAELWRVLKSNGRLLIVVPNRLGLWARGEWTPFGHGTPYTAGQMNRYLQRHLFVVERTQKALFMPPFRSFMVLRTAYTFESFGRYLFPGLAGLHLIEARKQIYAGAGRQKTQGKKRVLVAKSLPSG